MRVLSSIPEEFNFILETNGILIGHEKNYAKDLAEFENLHVRVSLKGTTAEEFSKLTGAVPEAFDSQLKALENLEKNNVSFHPALAPLAQENLKSLEEKLEKINPGLAQKLEIEELILYPPVKARLEKAGLLKKSD